MSQARILDGKRIADALLDQLKTRVDARVAAGLSRPGLAVVLVGNDAASQSYVRNKRRAAEKVGIHAFDHDLPASTSEGQLLDLIDQLNSDPAVHGILVQLPLPGIADATCLIHRIDPRKDVDGFHPANVGHLALRQFGLRPCTPRGIMTLLAHTDRPVRGRNATIVGVSNHVGRPMALELLIAGCTVTSCHKFTPPEVLEARVRDADILVVAVGRPGIVPGGVGQARCGGGGRGHQPARGRPPGRRRRLPSRGPAGQLDHPRPGRGRADDRGHPDAEHARSGRGARRVLSGPACHAGLAPHPMARPEHSMPPAKQAGASRSRV